MDRPYWDAEKPLVIQTERNCLRFFEKAERLQVGFAPYVNRRGEERMVKAVTLNLAALKEADRDTIIAAAELFEKLAGELRREADAKR
ncbi:MAG TPA: hypothetical protein PLU39_16585 [Armatimonadota bacterium]|nr:hypothetical protein [Armatimonadota bacterium]HOM83705.1 hypothetical protein [Armatimonadota bacterium]HPO74703.1 hypothetical protein [Armatimonadota bacterium]HPT99479.1 hypothetical protein [Armatimonadota bacterium]